MARRERQGVGEMKGQREFRILAAGMTNTRPSPFKRLILRAVLNGVSPIVARKISIPDGVEITELYEVFLSMLG